MLANGLRYVVGFGLLLFEPEMCAWRGRASLMRVVWLYGVVMSLGIGIMYLLAGEAGRHGLQQWLLIGFAVHNGWTLVAVWRCAGQMKPQSCVLMRSLVVAWGVNAVMVTGFLELDLMAIGLGT
ncbi:MAG: hypothetical protein IT555_03460 [Acetobacteraceae bacterium]|nr:hypothetical protein [Acetobacteraceae bacterium]